MRMLTAPFSAQLTLLARVGIMGRSQCVLPRVLLSFVVSSARLSLLRSNLPRPLFGFYL